MIQFSKAGFIFFIAVMVSFVLGAGGAYDIVKAEDTADVEALIKEMAETDDPCGTAELLSKTGNSRAVPALVELIKRNKYEKVRMCAAQSLAKLDAEKAVALLVAELNNPDGRAAVGAAFALGIIKDEAAADPLLQAFFESEILHCTAAEALGRIKAPHTLEPLIRALKSQNKTIRECAIWGLILFADRRACEGLTDVFMSEWPGGDILRLQWAMEAMETSECAFDASYAKKYKLSDTSCDKAQGLVEGIVPFIEKKLSPREWDSLLENEEYFKKIISSYENIDFGDPEVQMQLLILSAVFEWGKAVVFFRYEPEGETAEDRSFRLDQVFAVKRLATGLALACPKIKIPDYTRD